MRKFLDWFRNGKTPSSSESLSNQNLPITESDLDAETQVFLREMLEQDVTEAEIAAGYSRGDFSEKKKERIVQLIKQDRKARLVYYGIDSQVNRLKKLVKRIKSKHRKLRHVTEES